MKGIVLAQILSFALVCHAQEFYLQDEQGTTNGPFKLRQGTQISLGKAKAQIVRVVSSSDRATAQLSVRSYPLEPAFLDRVRASLPTGEQPVTNGVPEEMRRFLSGVSWPEGSSLEYDAAANELVVKNTSKELDRIDSILRPDGCLASVVDIEVQYVSFDLTNISRLAASRIDTESLTTLWTNGFGVLLAAPKVITRSGCEVLVKGVTECIYPTFFSSLGDSTNVNHDTAPTLVEPCDFQTREVGVAMTVMPEVSPEGDIINLTITPSLVEEPVWEDVGVSYVESNGKQHKTVRKQPYFHVYTGSISISIADGARVLMGGGMPSRDGKRIVYMFVSARRVGLRGESLNAKPAGRH